VPASENQLEYEKALQLQVSTTRLGVGKVLHDIKSKHEQDGVRKPIKKKRMTATTDDGVTDLVSGIDPE